MPDDTKKSAVRSMLFHLFKGLSQSVPVIGPIVDEILFEQFEEKLKGTVDGLEDSKIQHLLEVLPSVDDLMGLEQKIGRLDDEQKIQLTDQYLNLASRLATIKHSLKGIEEDTKELPRLVEVIEEIKSEVSQSTDQRFAGKVVRLLERRRQDWINRISRNQRLLCDSIPTNPTALSELWKITQSLIPECTYKEFRFRLHELEWLGLVNRFRDKDEWQYFRLKEVGNSNESEASQ